MHSAYTLNNRVATASFYVDDSLKGEGTHYSYSASTFEGYLSFYAKKLSEWRAFAVGDGLDDNRGTFLDTVKDIPKEHLPLVTLDHFYGRGGIAGRVVIFGTLEPWCEALVLSLGAKNVTTVEYNDLTLAHPSLATLKPAEFRRRVDEGERWDVAISISSFDHDGLGRYGDPLAPDADLKAMKLMREALHPSGLAFLSLPLGKDLLVWNLHRRYGPLRLPMILEGWSTILRVGWDEERAVADDKNYRQTYEPVLVLSPLPTAASAVAAEHMTEAGERGDGSGDGDGDGDGECYEDIAAQAQEPAQAP